MIADAAVRLATLADADSIAAMSRDYIEHGLAWRWNVERIAHAINEPDINVAVSGNTGSVAGLGIMSHAEEEAHLLLFAVRRSSQRRGVGSAILTWLEAVARCAGAPRIFVEARESNRAARSFYEAHGYQVFLHKPAMYGGVEYGVRMQKWLQG